MPRTKKTTPAVHKLIQQSRTAVNRPANFLARNALTYYASGAYQDINEPLRRGKLPSKQNRAAWAQLQHFLTTKAPVLSGPVVLYRGVDMPSQQYRVGDRVQNPMPLSTSYQRAVTSQFAPSTGCCLLMLHVAKGTRAFAMEALGQAFAPEKEVLLPSGTEWKVTDITHVNGQTVVHMSCSQCKPGLGRAAAVRMDTAALAPVLQDRFYVDILAALQAGDLTTAKRLVRLQLKTGVPAVFPDKAAYYSYLMQHLPTALYYKDYFKALPPADVKAYRPIFEQGIERVIVPANRQAYLKQLPPPKAAAKTKATKTKTTKRARPRRR